MTDTVTMVSIPHFPHVLYSDDKPDISPSPVGNVMVIKRAWASYDNEVIKFKNINSIGLFYTICDAETPPWWGRRND